MENEDWRAIHKIKKHLTSNPILFWIFYVVREFALQSGTNKVTQGLAKIEVAIRGAKIDGRFLNIGISGLHKRLRQLAYHGFILQGPNAERDDDTESVAYMQPIMISPEFISGSIPRELFQLINADELEELNNKIGELESLRKKYYDQTKRLREEVRLSRSMFVPEFKLLNKDGSVNRQSIQFQRMWAWFVLLDIQAAFQKIIYKSKDPDTPVQEPDYKTMAVWLSRFGMDSIEALFLRFYESNRMKDLKESAGDKWPERVLAYIYGALKKNHKETKHEKGTNDYVPAKDGW